jgi:hypothetical protein
MEEYHQGIAQYVELKRSKAWKEAQMMPLPVLRWKINKMRMAQAPNTMMSL